jgi:ribosome-binding factor A
VLCHSSFLLVSETMSRRNSKRRLRNRSAPHDSIFRSQNAQVGRKKMQLCRQVQEALAWALGTTIQDELLVDCSIADVQPLPGGNRLLVKVSVPSDLPPDEVEERLAKLAPALRAEAAQAITRRKAPELVFLPIPVG